MAVIKNSAPLWNLKEAHRFLGLISWYRCFIKDVAHIATPLHRLLKKRVKWEWTERNQEAFDKLKESLVTAPILVCQDWGKWTTRPAASYDGQWSSANGTLR